VISELRASFVRLAYPLQSAAFSELADSDEDRSALAQLMEPQIQDLGARAYVTAPFMYPAESRFSDGSYGVLYAAKTLRTAIVEKAYHLTIFFRDASAPAQSTRQVRLGLQFVGSVRDVRRGDGRSVPRGIYNPNDYKAAQKFGRSARKKVAGVQYDSVRSPGGECVAAFDRTSIKRARITGEIEMVWDGERFTEQHVIEPLTW
jgi:hypothetical protein